MSDVAKEATLVKENDQPENRKAKQKGKDPKHQAAGLVT